MFAVVPTAAAAPTEAALHSLADSAKPVADALRPFLEASPSATASLMPLYTIKKVASCKAVYSALLRSDGVLLLLSHPAADGAASSAHVSVLESGGEAVVDVAAGESHIVYCTVSGAVYSCGYDNTYGQLGDGSVWSSNDAADSLADEQNVGGVRELVLSAPRRIAGFGEGALTDGAHRGHLSNEDTGTPLSSLKDYRVAIDLAPLSSSLSSCTRSLTAAAKSTSTGDSAASWRHVPPPADRHIKQVACGAHHTLMLTRSGRCVYACGTGAHGQLGGSRPVLVQSTFRAIKLLFGVDMAQVAAGDAHSFVLLRNGLLYAFGDNTCGQLGLGHTKCVSRPTTVPLTKKEEYEASMPQDHAAATTKGHRHLDAKAYATLRAPYASTESTYYPLRVPRLQDNGKPHAITGDDNRDSGAAFTTVIKYDAHSHELDASNSSFRVVRVYCCVSWTLLETTNPGVWLSCGVPLTRGVNRADVATTAARIDGCGVLGRPLLRNKAEAYVFQPVNWAATLFSMRQNVDAATDALAAPPTWVGNEQQVFSADPSHGAGEGTSDALQLPGVQIHHRAPCSISGEGDSSSCTPVVTTAPAAGHCNTPDSRISSDTVPRFSHPNKGIENAILRVSDTLVSAYPTSLLVAFSSANAGDVGRDGAVTSMLIQSGSPAVVALEVRQDSSSVHEVWGSPTHASMGGPLTAESSGTSVLQVNSTHGAVIPLPSYVLVI
ncbi:cyclin-e binding protein 1-like protein [Leishmania donovani]|uniref:Cyclin-e_binding_protein_1-like_protein/GeneDB:Lm jF.36.2600 n=1 Tax=Leishmania donovani TaxID=5661 RepID=A0A504X2L3_LEIDO|nr:Regulator of chromosome condensation (RCC1) repeat family protein [Leishmania donovani]CAJ1993639.1 cyclin-e binding protein 1-like protein [Leishmania donovani]VDZ49462.1 cyclin-e_binding_protein_1-like_protein/GeneDB:LmjF.36.2600 [Leishmania donovani]